MSRISKKRLVSLGIPSAKIHVIPYGVHIPAELPIRVHSRQVRCIAVGRMVAKKAPHLVIKSFQLASQRDSRLHLDYVGGADWFPAIQMLVDQFELSDRVTLHGVKNHSETLQLIRNADIFIQHSILDPETGDEEGLPVSILEAMAQGLPVVSTRHAGIPEAVVHGETGMLGEEGDATTMANHIVQLANDDNLRHRLGKAGWVRALNNFSIKHESEKLIRTMGL